MCLPVLKAHRYRSVNEMPIMHESKPQLFRFKRSNQSRIIETPTYKPMFIVGGTRRLDSFFEISNQIVKLSTNKSTLNGVKVRFFF